MELPKNLDDLVSLGLQQNDPLTLALAKNLEAYREYAAELITGIKALEKMLKKEAV